MRQTPYARLNPWQARAVLAVLAVSAGLSAAIAPSTPGLETAQQVDPGRQDIELYRAEVARVRAGQGYYQAAASELSARGYPTLSLFNWRTPLSFWLLAALPEPGYGQRLLQVLTLAAIFVSCAISGRDEGYSLGQRIALLLLLIGALLPCTLKDMMFLPDAWSAVFLAVSAVAYGRGWIGLGVGGGLAAVFFRELALPYCVLAAALAWWQGQRRELVAWIVGLWVWAMFLAWHACQVASAIPPGGHAHQESWVQFGGVPFVLSTLRMNAYLFLLPGWVTGLWFAAALLGFAGWATPWGRRMGLAVCLYIVAFAIVGQEFNHYWGILVAPLYPFGVVRFPASIRDLARAAVRHRALV